jgi:hypothetical protein
MTPALVSPRTKPTPKICPKLKVASNSGKLKLRNKSGLPIGRSGPPPGFWMANLPIATATKLQITITRAVPKPQGSVWGIAAIKKCSNKCLLPNCYSKTNYSATAQPTIDFVSRFNKFREDILLFGFEHHRLSGFSLNLELLDRFSQLLLQFFG